MPLHSPYVAIFIELYHAFYIVGYPHCVSRCLALGVATMISADFVVSLEFSAALSLDEASLIFRHGCFCIQSFIIGVKFAISDEGFLKSKPFLSLHLEWHVSG